jgi:hypothetical protein
MKSIGKKSIGTIMRLRVASALWRKWYRLRNQSKEKTKLFKKSKN